ncbi:hypothetical protein ABT065_14315 [Streptomyces sp. NPDC002764]|uniref:hypothetical protein n=1 Tax=Streptomyces sp. NPDC002764 TaxID=3154428 RepID=UPI003324AA45
MPFVCWPLRRRRNVVAARKAAQSVRAGLPFDPDQVVYGEAARQLGKALRQRLREEGRHA